MKKTFTAAVAALLVGCSSPPPLAVDWEEIDMTQSDAVNAAYPNWRENFHVYRSTSTQGHWVKVVGYNGVELVMEPLEAYAVAHASRAIINATSGENYFAMKRELTNGGFTGTAIYNKQNRGQNKNYIVLIN